jgi:hypothetical protein
VLFSDGLIKFGSDGYKGEFSYNLYASEGYFGGSDCLSFLDSWIIVCCSLWFLRLNKFD